MKQIRQYDALTFERPYDKMKINKVESLWHQYDTLIACFWDTEAAEKLYEYTGVELCSHNIDSLLGPGINIHRSPLNGRNFEYLSEDPYLTGKSLCCQAMRLPSAACVC